jgi:uncharacterized membrane protein
MKSKILSLITLLMLIVPTLVLAENEIVTEIIKVSNQAEPGGTAQFQIKIQNHQNERDVYKINYDDLSVHPFSDFTRNIILTNPQLKLDSNQEGIFNIEINILETANQDKNYNTKFTISSVTTPEIKEEVLIKTYVVSPEDVIMIFPDLPETIIPGEEYEIKIRLMNRGNAYLENYEILITSDLPQLQKNFIANFAPQEEIIETLKIKTGETAKPKDYVINVKVYDTESKTRGSYSSAITLERNENTEEKINEDTGFLSKTILLTRKNNGNVKLLQKVEYKKNLFSRIFTKATPEPVMESGKYIWNIELEPGEKFTANIKSNYRPILYGLLIIILDKSVIIRKIMFKIKRTTEGLSELKILIHLRNGKATTLENVRILDVLPNSLEPTNEFGTLHPSKVQQGTRGRRLIWEIGTLAPHEERIISYKVKSKVRLIGETNLPPSMIQYMNNKGKIVSERSATMALHHSSKKII